MISGAGADGQRFSIRRVLQRMVEASRHNARTFTILILSLAALPQAAFSVLALTVLRPASGDWVAIAEGVPGESIVTTILGIALNVALLHGAIADWRGRRISVRECFAANKAFMTVFMIRVIGAFAVAFACLFLIVPGVWLALAWSMAVPAAVEERAGFVRAFGRSLVLTRGYRLRILAAVLVIGALGVLALLILVMVSALVTGLVPPLTNPLTELVVTPITVSGLSLIAALGSASMYHELRLIKEGPGPVESAEVFS